MTRHTMARILGVVIAFWAIGALAQPAPTPLEQLQQQLRDGRLDEALSTARQAVEVHQDMASLWYNLAGLEAHHGHDDAAARAFERAVVLGFDDFRYADRDGDLASMRRLPRYAVLRTAWADGLAAARAEAAVNLRAGQWSAVMDLREEGAFLDGLHATMRLRPDHGGLQVELSLAGPELPAQPPWRGGGGVLLNLSVPVDPVTGEGDHGVDLGFGWLDDLPAGAIRLGNHWQRLSELNPKMRYNHDEQRLQMDFRLPWSACGSLHPLVDRELGLNVAYVQHIDGIRRVASLLPDPGLGRADRTWRRTAPLRITWSAGTAAIQGRLDDGVVRDGDLTVTAAALLPEGRRRADIHVVMRDREGTMVVDEDHALNRDGNHWQAATTLAVTGDAGSRRLGVSLGADGARGLGSWETTVAVIPEGWQDRTRARLAAAPVHEQASLWLRFDAIITTLNSRHPRDDAGALANTLDELEAMLSRLETHGTALPAGGGFLAAAPSPDGSEPLPCSISLPDGWQRGDQVPVLLVLARAPGAADRAVSLVPRFLAEQAKGVEDPRLVVAIPHLPAHHDPHTAAARVAGLVTWLRQFLDCGAVHLAAVDLLAATCLDLADDLHEHTAGLLMFTGLGFEPYLEGEIAQRVSQVPTDLSLGWIWFPEETRGRRDQARAIRKALVDRGLTLDPRQSVPGGLRFDQAWMRAALWAAGLQAPGSKK